MITLYQLLGIAENANEAEIKAAFKKKAILYHPDKNPNNPLAEEQFKEINRAHQILGNPYLRAKYDMELKYGFVIEQTPEPQYTPPQNRPYKPYVKPKINYRENWIATGYAFLFTLVVAVIVSIFISIKNYYDNLKLEEKLTARREIFLQARASYEKGDIASSLSLINEMGGFYKTEEDIGLYKNNIIKELLSNGLINYETKNYSQALFNFEILTFYTDLNNLAFKEKMAVAYKMTNQPYKAIEILEQLLMSDYRFIFTYLELADLYQNYLSDSKQALLYLEKGNEKAKSYYESQYGKAYAVIISESNLPEIHFQLYERLANAYLLNNEPEKAIKTTRWNLQVWPNRFENYEINAKAYQQIGKKEEACLWHKKARKINVDYRVPAHCN